MLEVRDLTVTYPGREDPVLDRVSFTAAPGVLAVTGPSGSGKTSLLRCLSGSLRPCSGEAVIDGVRIATPRPTGHEFKFRTRSTEAVQARVAMVFQEYRLVDFLTVRENILLARELHRLPADGSKVSNLLDLVGIGELGGRYPRTLSGGQAQRVAIARALVMEPKLLLADEPTGALDRRNSDMVAGLFRDLGQSTGIPVVLATHDPRVARCAQKIVEITGDGRLKPRGEVAL